MRSLFLAVTLITSVGFAAPKETLQVGILAEFESLNPLVATQAASKWVLYMAFRPSFALDVNRKWYSPIFKQVPTLENKLVKKKGNGLEITVEFRDDMQWGDKTPMTCKDLEATWKIGKSDNVSVPEREQFTLITGIVTDAKNPKKCVVSYEKVAYNYLSMFPEIIPAHLESKPFEEFGGKTQGYDHNSTYTRAPTNPGLWNGPFTISEVKLGSHVVLTANPNWLGKKPGFKKIVVKLLPNAGTHISNLKAGNIDMIASAGGLGVDQAAAFEKEVAREKLPYVVEFKEGLTYAHIDLNLDDPILADKRVRHALSHGFNKKELVATLLEGKGVLAISNQAKASPWYNDKIKVYEYDRKKAEALLDEAGWKKGADGFRSKDGKRLTLQLLTAAGLKLADLFATYLQSQYKAIGVEITIKGEPPRVLFGETLKKRKFQLAFFSWTSQPESSMDTQFSSKAIPAEANAWSGQNGPGYKNAEVDKMLDDVVSEMEPKKRAAIAKKIVAQLAEDVPVIPLYFRMENSVVPKAMKGFKIAGHLYYETLNVEDWSWDQ